jgi:hypothetical protein
VNSAKRLLLGSRDSGALELAWRGRRLSGVVFEQRYNWGRAYRNGQLVCARVQLTVGRDGRLGVTRSQRRYVVARFSERVHPALRAELAELARRRGAAARRAAERMDPIELVFDDRHMGRPADHGMGAATAGASRRPAGHRVRVARARPVSDRSRRLTAEQLLALKFAAHRQLARWAGKALPPRKRAQRSALIPAVRVLDDRAFADGCELHAPDPEQPRPEGS